MPTTWSFTKLDQRQKFLNLQNNSSLRTTTTLRALISGKWYNLENLYKDCLYYCLRVKTGRFNPTGSRVFNTYRKLLNIFSETTGLLWLFDYSSLAYSKCSSYWRYFLGPDLFPYNFMHYQYRLVLATVFPESVINRAVIEVPSGHCTLKLAFIPGGFYTLLKLFGITVYRWGVKVAYLFFTQQILIARTFFLISG